MRLLTFSATSIFCFQKHFFLFSSSQVVTIDGNFKNPSDINFPRGTTNRKKFVKSSLKFQFYDAASIAQISFAVDGGPVHSTKVTLATPVDSGLEMVIVVSQS